MERMAGEAKMRVDLLLVERGLVPSRERARALILAGRVLVREQKVEKAGVTVPEPTTLIGSSLGGAFAIRAAARANDRVKHLVAVCPTGLGGVLDRPASGAQRAVAATFRSP